MDEEYLKLFGKKPLENLNETKQNQQWEKLNETPDTSQYNINENINDGWGNLDIQIETRINGIEQHQQYPNQLQPNSRRHKNNSQNLNGLDDFIDDEPLLREVIKSPIVEQTPIVENIQDVETVSIEMFENINTTALLTLSNNKIKGLDTSKMTNNVQPTTVSFLKS